MMQTGMKNVLRSCCLCPRNCRVDRLAGQLGYCGQGDKVRVARVGLHFWEEPCISGTAGSGTVFFAGCNLHCVFCQNHEIIEGMAGREISEEELAVEFLQLQKGGANNINLVTPTHFAYQIASALEIAKDNGLRIPVVYNTSSYENVDTLRRLEGLVDIYLPDFKYVSRDLAKRYSNAPDYFEKATVALKEMVRQAGQPVFIGPDGRELTAAQMNEACCSDAEDAVFLMRRGVIVRHLVLPGQGEDSKVALSWLYKTFRNRIYISIMNQYTPIRNFKEDIALNRKVTEAEYEELLEFALELGVENAFFQEGDTAEESFIPDWDF